MRWQWWVATQLAVLAYIGEIFLPFSEILLLSIIWKLEKRIFWLYVTFDLLLYLRTWIRIGSENLTDPSGYQEIGTILSQYIPHARPLNLNPNNDMTLSGIGAIVLAIALLALVGMIWFTWVKPIKAILHLRRRLLREIFGIQ